MAFTIEDGSGVAAANAYVSVADVDTHHSDTGNTRWADLQTDEKQTAIVRATFYVDKRFGKRFRGTKQSKSQGLEWPRLNAMDDDGFLYDDVPVPLKRAIAEYALRAAICQTLAPDPILPVPKQDFTSGAADRDSSTASGAIKRIRQEVDVIEQDITYETPAEAAARGGGAAARSAQSHVVSDFVIPEYPEADLWIEELLTSPNAAMTLVRA